MIDWLLAGPHAKSGELVFTAEPWLLAAASAGALLAFLLACLPLPVGRARAAELGATAAALLGLLLIVARPVWVSEGERDERGRFVVLVDASRSMAVAESEGTTRLSEANALVARLPGADVFHFGGDLRAGPPAGATLGATDIAGALRGVARRYAGERLAGIALISDGIDRAGLVVTDPDGSRRLDPSALGPLPGPLTAYAVGADRAVPDLSVTDMQAGSFAFLRAPFTLTVRVSARGLALDSTVVSLTRNGQPAGQKRVELDATGDGVARFTLTPDAPGRFIYEASVPAPPEDAVPTNNSMSRAVRTVRDRVRVLQVSGSPSLDQKFLRLFLKEDPGVDLVSFFILRTLEDFGAGYRGDELSLVEFPYKKLFDEELNTFDLVVLQNFDYAPYFERDGDALLANLAAWVKEGGALAMLGGDRSFDLGKYSGTPLAEVLPVQLGVPGNSVAEAPFTPRLTAAGARHPASRLLADPAENAELWGRLPAMDGANKNLGPAPGAAVLLEHPSERAGSAGMPVLAVRQVGQGRTLALGVDSSWRWSFSEAGRGGGNQAYLRFWKSTMRWLVGDPDEEPVRVDVARENVEPGEELHVVVSVRDPGFAALAGATVRGEVSGPGGSAPLEGVTAADGQVIFSVPTSERGAHRVKVRALSPDGGVVGVSESVYAVVTRDPELERIQPDPAALEALALGVAGRFVPAGSFVEPLTDPNAGRIVRDRRESALWSAPILGFWVAAWATTGWILRRRGGRA